MFYIKWISQYLIYLLTSWSFVFTYCWSFSPFRKHWIWSCQYLPHTAVSSLDECGVCWPHSSRSDPPTSSSPSETQPGGWAASGRLLFLNFKKKFQTKSLIVPLIPVWGLDTDRSTNTGRGEAQTHHSPCSICSCKSPRSCKLCRQSASGWRWWWRRARPAAQFTETSLGYFRKPVHQCCRREFASRERWVNSAGVVYLSPPSVYGAELWTKTVDGGPASVALKH